MIPFLKPPRLLPAPLPSEADFLEATAVFKGDVSNHRVVAVGDHFVVKYGRAVEEAEGQTLLFLEQHSVKCLTAPKLYAMWRMHSTGHLCLVMERLPGENLETLWPKLAEQEKIAICSKLGAAIKHMRNLSPPEYFGGVGRSRIPHHLFWEPGNDPTICGPLDTESAFNAAFIKKLAVVYASNPHLAASKIEYYERHLDSMLRNHMVTFSHSDLQRKNILVYTVGASFEIAIVDWEVAGWYPSYWEFAIEFATLEWWVDDWPKYLEQAIEPWPFEAAVFRMIYQDLWF
ncbi:kinase-like domain-containing protein [Lophiotrema nucula]|uniref:Kinase-like domain-containing protein n=1 Tax=Lophiotrema nucula TaxID=690887 RepID=A0A6A5YKJ1_9PLEO|nr:kinase-like domain-containing protein [Lophiotrema nucula]